MQRLWLLLICACPCIAQQTPLTFAVTGNLLGDDGTGIVGGYLSLQRLTLHPAVKPAQSEWTAVSGAGGAFRFDGPTEGKYRLCAQVPTSAWLNPCEWGLQPPMVSLPSAQPIVS